MNKFYITTPIYYVNDKPHIGHAYTSIAADFLARFKKLLGFEVKFLTGTDEHGQKVEKAANKAGMAPQEFTDKVSEKFRSLTDQLNLSNDDFIRTTEDRHKKAAKAIWEKIASKGHIYKGSYSGWYAIRDEAFYAEKELIYGKAPTGAEVEWHEEESYFFDLSKWQGKLLKFYEENPNFVFPEHRFNEVKKFVESGLEDLSISRVSFKWGIPVPGDEKHVMYVWFDALTNYLSAVGYPNQLNDFWPADIHMVGKDILRFHAVYWPAFLMAAGLPLPKKIVAHGWWTNEGQKISKSLGNVIDPIEITGNYGIDYFRYFVLREMVFGNDGNYSQASFENRVNSDLCNNLGNLMQRTLSFLYKNFEGKIPEVNIADLYQQELLKQIDGMVSSCKSDMDFCHFQAYIERIISLAGSANVYIDKVAPWKLRKEDPKACSDALYSIMECLRNIALLLLPLIPESADKMLDSLNVQPSERNLYCLGIFGALKPGEVIPAPEIIFNKIKNEETHS